MDETPLAPTAPRVAFSKRVMPEMITFLKTFFTDWPGIIINISLLLLLVLILLAASMSGSRIPFGIRQKESLVMSVIIANGLEQFLADYGRLPLPANGPPAAGDLDADTGAQPGLVAVLIGKEPPGSNLQNPRGWNYVEGLKPAKPGKNPNGPAWVNGLIYELPSQLAVVDAWGNLYRLRMATDRSPILVLMR